MRVIFATDNSIPSLLIRFFTWSRWHHCGVVTSDGKYVIEATFKHGVVKTPLTDFKARYKKTAIKNVPSIFSNWEDMAHKQLGKDYDIKAVIAIFFRGSWHDDNKWFCSELVGDLSGMFRRDRNMRVTPEHIWLISKDI